MENNEILIDETFFLVLKKIFRQSTRPRLVNIFNLQSVKSVRFLMLI